MTKEELEDKFEDCFDANTFPTQGGYGPDSTNKSTLWKSFQPIALEYAKQQAIAFVKWALESDKIHGDNWGDAFMPGDEEDVYNQFIEQQNKG